MKHETWKMENQTARLSRWDGLTSVFFSAEPSVSIPKLKTLLLFGVVYVLATNLGRRGVRVMAGLLIVSSLAGAGFSLMEKVWGRGMIVSSIEITISAIPKP